MLSRPPFLFAIEIRRSQQTSRSRSRDHHVGDLLVLDHARQAVGAEHVDVAQPRVVDVHVDLDAVLHAQRAHDDVLVREVGDLLRREVLDLDVVVEQRVVLGDLLEPPVAPPVEPAVAHVPDDQRAVGEQRRHHRRPHAVALRVLLRLLVDLEVGELDGRHHAVDVVAMPAVHLERPGQLLLVLGRAEKSSDGLDRHAARHLARRVPAHAVGDDRQPLALGQEERVLVVGALHPHVGLAREAGAHTVERERRAHGLGIVPFLPTLIKPLWGLMNSICGPSVMRSGPVFR